MYRTDPAGHGARKAHPVAQFSMAPPGFAGCGRRFGGVLESQPDLGIKTFLLIEVGIAILSPLLTAIFGGRDGSHRHRGK